MSLPELETDSAEGCLLGQIIQLSCWWGGAAMYIAVSILPDFVASPNSGLLDLLLRRRSVLVLE